MTEVTFRDHFSSAHFYRQDRWSEETNRRRFGRCFHPQGHGHNYELEVRFQEDENFSTVSLQNFVRAICDRFDHEHLNYLPDFRNTIPTTEIIAQTIWNALLQTSAGHQLRSVRLYEMNDLWVEVTRG